MHQTSSFGTRSKAQASQCDADSVDVTDILAGLRALPKTLPARLFYDEAGCALFGKITGLAEYYVTRAEMALLRAHGAALVEGVAPDSVLVEYGASDETKAVLLLQAAIGRLADYVPVDIAATALDALQARMRTSHPNIGVYPVVADFTLPLGLPAIASTRPRLGFFPGSTIGNFEPAMVTAFLRQARHDLCQGNASRGNASQGNASQGNASEARFIIGTDLRKDSALLVSAYDDASGVTAAFNRNILRHVGRLTNARFDPDLFAHRAMWNDAQSRIEMHLVSRLPQVIDVAGHKISFAAGESIHTESSYKHTREGFLALAARSGWRTDGFWTDPDGRFGMHRLVAA